MSLSLALGKPALALSFLAIVQSVQGIYTKGVKATTRHVLPPLNPSTTPTPAQLSLEAYAHCLHWGCHCQRCQRCLPFSSSAPMWHGSLPTSFKTCVSFAFV